MSDTKDTARLFFEGQDRLKGGPPAELLAEDYVARLAGYPPMDAKGHDAFASTFYEGFPDLEHTVTDSIGEDERVAVRVRITGTNTGSFMGGAATGKPIDIGAIVLMRFVAGRIAELHGEFDQIGLMQQIGALPTP